MDIGRNGDQDVIFGSETGPEVWWWENPRPDFDANKSWTRRTNRTQGTSTNRGQIVADITGAGWPQSLSI